MKKNFYEVKYDNLKHEIDDVDPIYLRSNNDLYKFVVPSRSVYHNVVPSDESYYDYYYQYMGMTKKMTLHDEIINSCEDDFCVKKCNKKRRRKNHLKTYGIPNKMLLRDLNLPEQPVFNDKFLNKISQDGYTAIYSSKK